MDIAYLDFILVFFKDWDPKTFFNMHDLDGNGRWDENEVRILFRKELDKVFYFIFLYDIEYEY